MIREWLLKIALEKGVKKLVILGVSYVVSLGLEKYGVNVDVPKFQEAAFAGVFFSLDFARNFFKVKFNLKFL